MIDSTGYKALVVDTGKKIETVVVFYYIDVLESILLKTTSLPREGGRDMR